MVDLGYCIGRCEKLKTYAFWGNKKFIRGDLVCYNMAIKFGCCIKVWLEYI